MNKRRVKVATISTVIIVGLVVVSLTVRGISQPSKGLITYPTAATIQPVSSTLHFKSFNSSLVSFSYPSTLSVYPAPKPTLPTLANYSFLSGGANSWFLAVSILDLPGQNLNLNGAYQYRKTDPKVYQQSELTIDGQTVTVMTDVVDPGYDRVAFLTNSSYQATVALTAGSSSTNLDTAFDTILSSWQWH